jgi:transcriptional regulator GlxA family with amidase domain
MQPQLKRIAMLLFDGCDLLDFAGPTGVFHSAARHLIRTAQASELLYVVEPLSIDGGGVRTLQNVIVETNRAPELSGGEFDTIMVTGGLIDHLTCDPRLLDWLKRNHGKVRRVASVCCGAFILAGAGLLEGRRATTHWEDSAHLQESFAGTEVRPDSIYVQDGNVWTSAGITSGIDMALAMVEEDYGHALALLVARNLVVFIKRPGGQSQFSAPLQSQTIEGPLSAVLGWIVDNPCEDLRTERLAERANMSLRNFFRAFEAATGTSPADWVEMARMEIAKRFLEQGSEKVEQVAYKAGFTSYEQMRKVFSRRIRISPKQYRARFGRRLLDEEAVGVAAFHYGSMTAHSNDQRSNSELRGLAPAEIN